MPGDEIEKIEISKAQVTVGGRKEIDKGMESGCARELSSLGVFKERPHQNEARALPMRERQIS
jgi:hypothetical protein